MTETDHKLEQSSQASPTSSEFMLKATPSDVHRQFVREVIDRTLINASR